ncbi:hypothetical protein F2Q68_00029031 [Brassica cretica]|uniref:Tify domain-containing protein n=1 Tax=Brassica cretica TaxID=69181 RepID=A0A8S9GCD3_BRACR|nr:hypothetical protein F2Q68_00029031 [Brassica cretica]
MVGGGNRRDEGSMPIQNTNLFAALDTRRKKKKSDKSKGRQDPAKEPEPQVFWAPTPLKAKAWADIDSDDEDDDYFATTAPPKALWSTSEASRSDAKEVPVEESESEEDILDEGDDDDDDLEEEHETQVHPEAETEVKKAPEVPAPPKEPERQLSKKELKQKEQAEFDAFHLLHQLSSSRFKDDVVAQTAADEGSRTGKKGPRIMSSYTMPNPSKAECYTPSSTAKRKDLTSSTKQMTIFYGGQAHVFDDVHPNKADVIMALAGSSGGSWSTDLSHKLKTKNNTSDGPYKVGQMYEGGSSRETPFLSPEIRARPAHQDTTSSAGHRIFTQPGREHQGSIISRRRDTRDPVHISDPEKKPHDYIVFTEIDCFQTAAWQGKIQRIKREGIDQLPLDWLIKSVIGSAIQTLSLSLIVPYVADVIMALAGSSGGSWSTDLSHKLKTKNYTSDGPYKQGPFLSPDIRARPVHQDTTSSACHRIFTQPGREHQGSIISRRRDTRDPVHISDPEKKPHDYV